MMNRMKEIRTFVAVPIPEHVQTAIGSASRNWRSRLSFQKWVHERDYHITLKFIGNIPEAAAAKISDVLSRTIEQYNPASFRLRLGKLDTFGNPAQPSILWSEVLGELEPLRFLQHQVERALEQLGYPSERRNYTPHLTVARRYMGNQPYLGLSVGRQDDPGYPDSAEMEWEVNSIALYESKTDRIPMYAPIAIFPF